MTGLGSIIVECCEGGLFLNLRRVQLFGRSAIVNLALVEPLVLFAAASQSLLAESTASESIEHGWPSLVASGPQLTSSSTPKRFRRKQSRRSSHFPAR